MFSEKIYQLEVEPIVDPEIKEEIRGNYYSLLNALPKNFEWSYVNRSGKLSKRLAKYASKVYDDETYKYFLNSLSIYMNFYTIPAQILEFDVSTMDWEDGEFGDSGSCYWKERIPARQLIRDNGGGAIRFYKNGKGYARAWIMPKNDGYIIFNGYGLSTGIIAAIFGQWKNLPVNRITLENNCRDSGLIYINEGSYGVNLSDPEYDLEINTNEYCLCDCGTYYHNEDTHECND